MTPTRSVSLLFLSAAIGWTQTTIDLKTQVKNIDFSGFPWTKPAQVGTILPPTCSTGQLFFKSDATSGSNLYGCAQNAWALQGGAVASIFGRTGNVQPLSGDYNFGMISGVASLSQGGTGAGTPAQALLNLGAASLLDLTGYQTNLGFSPLNPANNLSDLTSAGAARSNLELGPAALMGVQGLGTALSTTSGAFSLFAIPTLDSTGTQVDSGCSASAGLFTCSSGTPTRLGLTKGTAPSDTVMGGPAYDAVLFQDAADNALKLRRNTGPVVVLGSHTINFTVDGGGAALIGGSYPIGQISSGCTLTGWSLMADQPGSISIDLDAHSSSAPPSAPFIPNTTTDKISASAPMALSNAQSASGGAAALSTWTVARSAWDSFRLTISGTPVSVTRVTGAIYCQ